MSGPSPGGVLAPAAVHPRAGQDAASAADSRARDSPGHDGPALLRPLRLRGLQTRNRLWLSPMCQYSAVDGVPNDWHLVHLGARASGGWGLVFTEATAVRPDGRISDGDTGIWNDAQRDAWTRIVDFSHERGAPIALQLAHAGRKASIPAPWADETGTRPPERGGWRGVSVTEQPFPGFTPPRRAGTTELGAIVADFAAAAARGVDAGFDAIEILAGHGFLIHSFLSPLTNDRDDGYGGDQRSRLLREIVTAVRGAIPPGTPLLVRLSATDWLPGGLTVDDSASLATELAPLGVDLVDASSGGLLPAPIPLAAGYQVPGAAAIRAAGVPAAAVGLITSAAQAEDIVRSGRADAVLIGRAALRDPSFALRAAHELGADAADLWPRQYERGAWPADPA